MRRSGQLRQRNYNGQHLESDAFLGVFVLWGRVHEVEFALVLHYICDTWVLPYRDDRLGDPWVKGDMRVWVDLVVQEIVAVVSIVWVPRFYIELSHCSYQGLGAIQDVLVYRQPVQGQLIFCVPVLVDDLHLFHDR